MGTQLLLQLCDLSFDSTVLDQDPVTVFDQIPTQMSGFWQHFHPLELFSKEIFFYSVNFLKYFIIFCVRNSGLEP